MKIAITCDGQDLKSPVDARFGRAMGFIIYDLDSGEFVFLNNRVSLDASQGAGIQAARAVIDAGVGALVTGNVGPKAYTALNAAGVHVFTGARGTVWDAVEDYRSGVLCEATGANVEGHW